MASKTGELLKAHDLTVGVAESITGGLIAHYLTGVPGSSGYFKGGVVAYRPDLKEQLLKVSPSTLAVFGAVSEETAREMAAGARSLLGADFALATTGLAGRWGHCRAAGRHRLHRAGRAQRVTADRLFWPRLGRDGLKSWLPKRRSIC